MYFFFTDDEMVCAARNKPEKQQQQQNMVRNSLVYFPVHIWSRLILMNGFALLNDYFELFYIRSSRRTV